MVAVAVRQDDGSHVVERSSDCCQFGRELPPVGRCTGVDDRHVAAVLEEVAVHHSPADPSDPGTDLDASYVHARFSAAWLAWSLGSSAALPAAQAASRSAASGN